MCNLHAVTIGQAAIRELTRAMTDQNGNLPRLPGIFPAYPAPIIRNQPDGRELTMARWGMSSPNSALKGRKSDPGLTNIWNVSTPNRRCWLSSQHRALVPFTSFAEHEQKADGSKPPIWFAQDNSRPLFCYAGIWANLTSVRQVTEGETTNGVFGFQMTKANDVVYSYQPKAKPMIPDRQEGVDLYMSALTDYAIRLR